ncbi:hypothetical protein C2G38_2074906 [Gigaspora rosea]|uniref:Uncharacterized protein n=1 Tax=Gigaspora rosea TaxID=44941 RepID=A0A397VJT8_9GLOM|nr:hypothetical protein C2G38_2074906 [Gigaspora rosea]
MDEHKAIRNMHKAFEHQWKSYRIHAMGNIVMSNGSMVCLILDIQDQIILIGHGRSIPIILTLLVLNFVMDYLGLECQRSSLGISNYMMFMLYANQGSFQ